MCVCVRDSPFGNVSFWLLKIVYFIPLKISHCIGPIPETANLTENVICTNTEKLGVPEWTCTSVTLDTEQKLVISEHNAASNNESEV